MSTRAKATIVDVAEQSNIQTITETHRKLLQGLQQSGIVELCVDSAADVDLTFVQLIEAARRYAVAESKTLALSMPAETNLHDVLQRGGFVGTAADRAFWFHETGDN
jgi:hypothetical protein